MAPNVPSESSPCDIWTSITGNDTANDTAHFNHFNKPPSEAITNKRLKVDVKESSTPLNINNNIVVNGPSLIHSEIEPDLAENKKKSKGDNCEAPKVKMRRSSYDSAKVTSRDNAWDSSKGNGKTGVKAFEKPVGVTAKQQKQDRSRHQGKITEYFKSQIKSLVGMKRDFGGKKDVGNGKQKIGGSGKDEDPPPLKKLKGNIEEKLQLEVPVFLKPSPKPLQTVMPLTESSRLIPQLSKLPKSADFLLKKPAETKTLFNKILQNHKNRKLAESYLKCRTILKPKAGAETEVSKPSHKPYETSTSNAVTEMPNTNKLEELSSKLGDNKVQNTNLDSNSLNVVSNVTNVTNFEVISTSRSDPLESDSSKSPPILSAPKTIRFPAICHTARVDKHRATRETISCRWDACSVEADSANGLLEHLQVRTHSDSNLFLIPFSWFLEESFSAIPPPYKVFSFQFSIFVALFFFLSSPLSLAFTFSFCLFNYFPTFLFFFFLFLKSYFFFFFFLPCS